MTEQNLPFPSRYDPPLARPSDPETSQQAAEEIARVLPIRWMDTFRAVAREPGLTASEMERRDGVQRSDYGRRLGELARIGKICRGEPRKCRITGKQAATWWPNITIAGGPRSPE